jgi:hypothetical protein
MCFPWIHQISGASARRGTSLTTLALGIIASIAGLISFVTPAWAERHALLVGVSGYSGHWRPLPGVENDLPAMHAALLRRGFDPRNIRVLADRLGLGGESITSHGIGTRRAIMEEFARLERIVRRGDYVFIQLSGHGSQQRVTEETAANEPDGLDEVFIPLDGGPSDGNYGPIENGILDDEIGDFLDRLREAGAEVWILFDTCHSGSMTRAGTSETLRRPVELVDDRVARDGAELARGNVVAFFSAQPAQEVKEVEDSDSDPRRPYGPLSLHVARALAAGDELTYLDVANRVLSGFDRSRAGGVRQSMPMFEGELTRPVFGGGGAALAMAQTWPAAVVGTEVHISGGLIDGLQPGREIVVRQGGAALGAPLARLTLSRVGLVQSTARLPTAGPLLPTHLVATPVEPLPPHRIRVALPAIVGESEIPPWLTALTTLLREDARFTMVLHNEGADARLVITPAGIWVSDGGVSVDQFKLTGALPVSSGAPADSVAREVLERLEHRHRADRLLRLAEVSSGARAAASLAVEIRLLRAPRSKSGADCPTQPAVTPSDAVPVPPEGIPDLDDCDTLYVLVRNTGPHTIDLGFCLVQADGRVRRADGVVIRERGQAREASSLRLGPRQSLPDIRLTMRNQASARAGGGPRAGAYRLLVFAVERRSPETLGFPFTISAHVCPDEPATRSATAPTLTDDERRLLAGFVGGPRTRQTAAAATLEGGLVRLVRWTMLPPG